jgi:hypothetical protein
VRPRGETGGPRLYVEGEFRSLGAKFDRAFGKPFDLAGRPLAIEKGPLPLPASESLKERLSP